jgi:hypothetical protein
MKMNQEHIKAIAAGRLAAQERYSNQVIEIDTNWTIRRSDEFNWEILYKRQFVGYYGTLVGAFEAISRKMLNTEAKSSVAKIIEAQKDINQRINAAINKARKNPFL